MANINYIFNYITVKSLKRDINQDAYYLNKYSKGRKKIVLAAIADGMGGLSSGNIASKIAMKELSIWWSSLEKKKFNFSKSFLLDDLDKVFYKINNSILKYSTDNNEKMGTTLAVVFIMGKNVIIKNIGDTRVYLANDKTRVLSFDHTWVNNQIIEGKLNPKDAMNHPKSHVLTQCLGVKSELNIYTSNASIKENDLIIICSDGFYKKLDVNQLKVELDTLNINVEEFLEQVTQELRNANERDDITVIIIRYTGVRRFFNIKKFLK